MSFDSLPPELLCDIIEAAIPHSYHWRTYEDRQTTLCNLCLVSRRFRQIAQPLLFGIVRIESEEGFQKLHRSLSKWFNARAPGMLSDIRSAISALTITVYDGPSLKRLSPLQNLSDLHLRGLSFRPATPFPSLRSLTLGGFRAIRTFLSNYEWIALPSLRYLALSDVENAFRDYRLSDNSVLARLLPQLEAWSIDLDALQDAYVSGDHSTLRPFLSRALVDCCIWSEDLHLIRSEVFNDAHPFQAIEKVCKEKGIEMVFEEQHYNYITNPVVSQEFSRRMKLERSDGNVSY